jgi:hypothetical protein
MKFLIRGEGRLGMFQVPLRDPGIFFEQIPFPSDQEEAGERSSFMTYNLFDLIFFFPLDKFRWWRWEVLAVDFIFTIWSEKGGVEHIVNFPSLGKSELVNDRR